MITLCMDTSHVFLAVSLIDDGKVVAKMQKECWKQQSEEIFPALEQLLKEANKTPDDIDEVVISKGPGSYTGVRIAMTIAKVFCALKKVPLKTVGTLQLYAGKKNVRVVIDARSNRSYTCEFNEGKPVSKLEVLANEEVKQLCQEKQVIGNGSLIGREDVWTDIAENFLALQDCYETVENVHLLVPEYLKPSESYLVKKHDS